MKAIHIIGSFFLAGLMALGFIVNNAWRWLPEFSTLDSIAGFSIYLQMCLLLLAVFAIFITFRGKQLIHWILLVLAVLASVVSWYSVRVSDAENAFFYGVFPFAESKVHFSEVNSIKFRSHSLVIKPAGAVVPIPSKILGFDSESVVSILHSYGECLERVGQARCAEVKFAWP